jgi:hypothetical protein
MDALSDSTMLLQDLSEAKVEAVAVDEEADVVDSMIVDAVAEAADV